MTEGVPYQAYRSKRRECPSQQSQLLAQSQLLVQSQSLSQSQSQSLAQPQSLSQSQSLAQPQSQSQSQPQSQSQSQSQSQPQSSPSQSQSQPQSSPSQSQSQPQSSPSQFPSPSPGRQSTFRRLPRRPPRNFSLPNPSTSPVAPPPPVPASPASTRPPSVDSSATSQRVPSQPLSSSASPTPRVQAPYRPGFQPKGLYRPLTDEFLALRRLKRDGDGADGRGPGMKRVERAKMLRRLEKLIDLHFPSPSQPTSPSRRPQEHRRASSFFDFDIRKISISDAGDLFRGVVGGGDVNDLRAAEQRITPWQDDANVIKCPLCSTSFHPLTNRKHHCRLCGQIICSLPVKHPHRPVTCSLLFVVDPETRRIEEVNEGVDYGVRRKPLDNSSGTSRQGGPADDKFLKGVRICRSCRPILLRQQYQFEFTHVPLFSRLYQAFIALEQELEESIPQFQELVLSLSLNDQLSKEASISRKRLLEAFAQYDALAKRIRKLPCPAGSSADQVQASIMNRANLFLQKNMFPLQSLPQPKKVAVTEKPISEVGQKVDPDSEMAMALQPLLEQEALLESFVEEAKAHRKFEDVKTLKSNLQEIRAEIDRVVANADAGLHR